MRSVSVAALAIAAAALAARNLAAPVAGATLPVWALFTFAVSAFREPLR